MMICIVGHLTENKFYFIQIEIMNYMKKVNVDI